MATGTTSGTKDKKSVQSSLTASPSADWKTFQHSTGLSLRYPGDWTFSVQGAAATLTPPDLATNAQGPIEAYLLLSEGANGVTSVDDPRVIPYLENQLAQFIPFLQRTEKPESIRIGNISGIALQWSGQNPLGLAVRAFMQATILKGYAIALLALGDQTKIANREAIVRAVFASLNAGAGEHDAQLVGSWKFWSYKSSADGRYGSETSRQFRLQPDGICFWSSNSESSGNFSGRDSLGNTTWAGNVASQSGSGVSQGQWTAGSGQLNVLWADGTTSRWTYQVHPGNGQGRRLFLQGDQTKPDEWVEM
jgi:hypothetical protein